MESVFTGETKLEFPHQVLPTQRNGGSRVVNRRVSSVLQCHAQHEPRNDITASVQSSRILQKLVLKDSKHVSNVLKPQLFCNKHQSICGEIKPSVKLLIF